jgi:hypothetical protein
MTVTGIAETVGAPRVLGVDFGEEPAGVPVWAPNPKTSETGS